MTFLRLLLLVLVACGSRVPATIETVNGHQIEIATAGSGPVTVVFEAGLGLDWTNWDEVAGEVSRETRVFAYSRPGYGTSDPATTPRDPQHIVDELRELLAVTGHAPPYVLVGHSIGGGYVELFAKAHPDEVIGVVLVDPRHRDFLATCEAAQLDNCGITESQLATQPTSAVAEYHAFSLASDQIGAAGPFGAYPVRVLTATDHPVSPARERLWEHMLSSLAAEAPDGEQIIVAGAGHVIQAERPDAVINSILELL
jgi:pimeloyl-ACP methyl ester carboxylesterase